MRKIGRFLIIAAAVLSYAVAAQDIEQLKEHFGRERTYDVLHYKLDIGIDEQVQTVSGDVEMTLVPLRPQLSELSFDAEDMQIHDVQVGKKSLQYLQRGDKLEAELDEPLGLTDTLKVKIRYSASPKVGLYFVRPDSAYPNRPWQVWSQGQSEYNHFWFPCYDYPNDFATSETIVTVNEHFTVIGNGKLVGVRHDRAAKTKTFHWRESKPHVSYLISLVAGEYAELKDSWDGIPISYYVYPQDTGIARLSFSKTPRMVKFFSEKIGFRYPWEKYAQTVVADFIYGGMENVSATTLTDYTVHNQRAHRDYTSDGLVAHELAHQWWGNLLTCRDWSHAWLNEGFATYFENAFQESKKVHDHAAYEMLGDQGSVIGSDVGSNRRPTVTNRFVDVGDIFDNRIYAKGACILHMLRFVLGDELFWKSIRHYVSKYAFQNVETNDFKIAIEEAAGRNLHWFFDQWVYNAGYPEFEITSRWDSVHSVVDLAVKQVQQERDSLYRVFRTPVAIEIWSGGHPRTEQIKISRVEETLSFACDAKPELVVFDKGNWLLKKASFQKSMVEWLYQLKHAEMIDRVLAVRELKAFVDSAEVRQALGETLLQDSVWQLRVEAARALGASRDMSVTTTLMKAYADSHPRVREAVVAELESHNTPEVLALLRRMFAQDSSDAVTAAALRAVARMDTVGGRELCLQALSRDSHGEKIRIAAVRGLAESGNEEAFGLVKDYTRYGVRREIRTEAVAALARTWNMSDDAADYLITLLDDPSFHVRRAVIDALGTMPARQAIEKLDRKAKEEPDARMRRAAREAIAKINKKLNNTSH